MNGASIAAPAVLCGVVGRRIPAYLNRAGMFATAQRMAETMPETIARPRLSAPLFVGSLFVALALAGSGLLWAYYGTTVFFETIRAGFSACFG
jgi:hypothetical protein